MAGEILKQRREELGRDIREVADLLKIKADYLVSIENDSFERLPAPVYTMGYIRCYAAYLGVDADSIIEHYTKNLSQPAPPTIIPVGYSHKKGPGIIYIIGGAAVLGLVVFLVYAVIRQGKTSGPAPSQQSSAPVQEKRVETPAAKEVTAPKATPPPSPAAAPIAGQHKVTVEAVAKTWLMVRFADGRTEESLMRPGETKSWSFPGQVAMKIGNAGGVRLRLDGRDLGTPGEVGEVKLLQIPAQEGP